MTTTQKAKSKIIPLIWDEHEVIENQALYLLEQGEAANEKEAFEIASSDSDHIGFAYGNFLEDFSAILKKLSPKGRFHIEGSNMGWRHLSGQHNLEASNAQDYIARSFPRTSEWKFSGEFNTAQKILTYKLYHHDAPTGENYTVTQLVVSANLF